jgi:hypothetical protein
MAGPVPQAFGRKSRAFSCAGKTVIRDSDHTEIRLVWREVRAVQVTPKAMIAFDCHICSPFNAPIVLFKNNDIDPRSVCFYNDDDVPKVCRIFSPRS